MKREKLTIDMQLLRSHMIRYCQKYKVAWLAMQADVTDSCVSYHIQGKRIPRINTILAYAMAMDKRLDTYIQGSFQNQLSRAVEEKIGFVVQLRPSSQIPSHDTAEVYK